MRREALEQKITLLVDEGILSTTNNALWSTYANINNEEEDCRDEREG